MATTITIAQNVITSTPGQATITPLVTGNLRNAFSNGYIGTPLTIEQLLSRLFGILLTVVVFAAVVYLILNGFKFIRSGGDKAKADEAVKGIVNVIIGLLVSFSSWIIVNYILTQIGIGGLQLFKL